MKLFKEENFEVSISEEAYTIKAFSDLIRRDKDKHKRNALTELSFLYFFIDPRSDFNYILDQDEKMSEIKAAIGLPESWKPDDRVLKAMDMYKKMTHTISSITLQDLEFALDKIRCYIRDFDLHSVDDKGKPIIPIGAFAEAVKKVNTLIPEIQKTKEAVDKEIIENEKIRGNKQKKILEDGSDIFFK